MWVRPYIKEEGKSNPKFIMNIRLREGPVNRLHSLERLLSSIERNILQGYRWQWKGIAKLEFFEKLKREVICPKNIDIGYIIEDLSENDIKALKSKIKLESEIRLFDCQLEIRILS